MFSRKTVFIVGAGANVELKLPAGDGLKNALAQKLNLRFDNGYDLTSGDRRIYEAIQAFLQKEGKRDPNPLCGAGRTISAAMPQAISIDNFLHTHNGDEEIVLIGKLGIAASIIDAEANSSVSIENRHTQKMNFATNSNVWLNSLCKMLCEGVRKDELDSLFENVGFITFNYDRCIEHFIPNWLSSYMQIGISDAEALTQNLTIIHPYGQVGRLPWQAGNSQIVPFGHSLSPRNLPEVASQIRTFTERVEDDVILKRMNDMIIEAQNLVYLGFSYGRMNMELLQAEGFGPPKTIYGTTYGMSDPNVSATTRRISLSCYDFAGNRLVERINLHGITANQLLNDYWYELSE